MGIKYYVMECGRVVTGLLVCVLAFTGSATGSREPANAERCPSESLLPDTTAMVPHPYNNKCYQFVHVERYWKQARDYCRRYGGRLVTLPDAATNSFILRKLNSLPWKNRGVWIGLHDRANEMVWEWNTDGDGVGERATWTNWGNGHPRAWFHHIRDCVRMVRGSGTWRWHETPCAALSWKYRWICEYEMLPITIPHVGTAPATVTKITQKTSTLTKRSTTTLRYGVAVQGGISLLNRKGYKGVQVSSSFPPIATTEDIGDVVVPQSLQQNNNGGDTSGARRRLSRRA